MIPPLNSLLGGLLPNMFSRKGVPVDLVGGSFIFFRVFDRLGLYVMYIISGGF